MFRLCVARAALVLLVSLIFEGAKVWLLVKPWKRLRQWRTKRKMRSWHEEHGGPPDEVLEVFHSTDEVRMNEQLQSFLRGAAKFVAGALAVKAGLDAADASALQVAIEALVSGVVGITAFYLSHKKHA